MGEGAAVVLVCVLLVLCGVVVVVRWGDLTVAPPEPVAAAAHSRWSGLGQRYLWWATVLTVSLTGALLMAAGAGGRLVMRLLAVTTPKARGDLTEADQVIGSISVEGTLGYLVFGALPTSVLAVGLFALVHRWLPAGRRGGLVLGVLLLLASTVARTEPLRRDNVDFDILGPGWLAVLLFTALVLLHGMVTTSLAGWYGRRLPLVSRERRTWWPYLPLLAAVVLVPWGALLLVGAVVAAGVGALPRVAAWYGSPAADRLGRVAIAVACLACVPAFALVAVDLATR